MPDIILISASSSSSLSNKLVHRDKSPKFFSFISLACYSYEKFITSGTVPGLFCTSTVLGGPVLISSVLACPGDQITTMKIQDMETNPSPVKIFHEKWKESHARGILLVPSLQSDRCQVGNLTFGSCMCQCSLKSNKLLGWTFPLKHLYLAEMFNKTLCRERYFIQKNVLSLVTPLTLVEEVSFLSWWWFICSIKPNDKVHSAFNGTGN